METFVDVLVFPTSLGTVFVVVRGHYLVVGYQAAFQVFD
jgi:hypothetical protein